MNENEQMFLSGVQEPEKAKNEPDGDVKKVYSTEEVEAMRQAHEKALSALEDELHDVKVGHALEKLFEKSGAKNPDFLRRMVNVRDIPLDENGIPMLSTVEAMLGELRKTDGYLFTDAEKVQKNETFPPYRAPAAADESQMSDAAYYAQRLSRH